MQVWWIYKDEVVNETTNEPEERNGHFRAAILEYLSKNGKQYDGMFELTHSTEFHQLDAETKRNGFLEILEQFDETSEKEKLRVEQLKLHVNIPIIFKGPRRKLVITSIYAISRFIAKILLVPISPKFFEIYISNYF